MIPGFLVKKIGQVVRFAKNVEYRKHYYRCDLPLREHFDYTRYFNFFYKYIGLSFCFYKISYKKAVSYQRK